MSPIQTPWRCVQRFRFAVVDAKGEEVARVDNQLYAEEIVSVANQHAAMVHTLHDALTALVGGDPLSAERIIRLTLHEVKS